MKQSNQERRDTFNLPTNPGTFLGFYFSCGPVASVGFLIGDLVGFLFAIVFDLLFWFLLMFIERIKRKITSVK